MRPYKATHAVRADVWHALYYDGNNWREVLNDDGLICLYRNSKEAMKAAKQAAKGGIRMNNKKVREIDLTETYDKSQSDRDPREIDLTTRGHSGRGKGDRIYRLQQRLEKIASQRDSDARIIGVLRGILDFLADEYDTERT